MANKGKRMLFEDEYRYLDKVIETYPDPTDIGGGGGSPIEAGTGIEITGDETKTISIDNTVALKTDIPTTATSTSTVTPSTATVVDGVTYTPATETLTFTYDDDTTATITILTSSTTVTSSTATVMTGASVSTTTTLS